jgi:hypothetical protein
VRQNEKDVILFNVSRKDLMEEMRERCMWYLKEETFNHRENQVHGAKIAQALWFGGVVRRAAISEEKT